jgi:hypothetical protein
MFPVSRVTPPSAGVMVGLIATELGRHGRSANVLLPALPAEVASGGGQKLRTSLFTYIHAVHEVCRISLDLLFKS